MGGSATSIRFRVDPGSAPAGRPGRGASGRRRPVRHHHGLAHPSLHRLTGWAMEQGVELEDLSVSRPSLEDLFIEIVGAPGEEGRQE